MVATFDYAAFKIADAAGHPTTGAFSADLQTAADEWNELNRARRKSSVTGSELWRATNAVEFLGMTAAKQSVWMALCQIDTHTDLEDNGLTHEILKSTLGTGPSQDNLVILRDTPISLAIELGFGHIGMTHLRTARSR